MFLQEFHQLRQNEALPISFSDLGKLQLEGSEVYVEGILKLLLD
jgi:hypothetical protein